MNLVNPHLEWSVLASCCFTFEFTHAHAIKGADWLHLCMFVIIPTNGPKVVGVEKWNRLKIVVNILKFDE